MVLTSETVNTQELLDAISARHSVRAYFDRAIEPEIVDYLQGLVTQINQEAGLSFQLRFDDSRAFDNVLARYGSFTNTKNYLALVARKDDVHEELCGYWGEHFVLCAQQQGLKSCWVGGTYSKRKAIASVKHGEKLHLVISLGYSDSAGKERRVKSVEDLGHVVEGDMPLWFRSALEAVQKAPSAMNQQRYLFTLEGTKVTATAYKGFYTTIDLGIAKFHFEVGAAAAGATSADWQWA